MIKLIKLLIIVVILFLCELKVYANSLYLLQPYKASIEYQYIRDKRDSYLPKYSTSSNGLLNGGNETHEWWVYGAVVNLNLNLIKYKSYRFYWENSWYMESTNRQVRSVGWIWRLGAPITNKINLYYYHHSRHCLECNPTYDKRTYPIENKYSIEFILMEGK